MFARDQLDGGLSSYLGNTIPNLMDFNAAMNHLTRQLPSSVANATKLLKSGIADNNISGLAPNLKNLN